MKHSRWGTAQLAALGAAIVVSCAGVAPIFAAELTVYSFKGTPGQEADMPEINKLFEAAYPDIKLNYVAMPGGTPYETKVQTELLAGKSADVIMSQGTVLTQLAKDGYFMSMEGEPWAKDVQDGVRPFFSDNGTLYAMPLLATGLGLFSNMDVLAKSGVTQVPTDWPSFLDALAKVKAAGFTPLAVPDKLGWGGAMTMLTMGATLVPPTWGDDFWNGKTNFAAWLPVLKQIMELQDKGFINWKDQLGVDEFAQGLPSFEKGDTAFWIHGQWNLADLTAHKINFKLTGVPAGPAGSKPSVFLFAGAGWTINAASPNLDAAKKYVEFQSRPEISLKYIKADGGVTSFKGRESPDFPGMDEFNASVKAGNFSYMATTTWFGGDVQTKIGSKLQAMLLGQITPEDTITALEALALKKE